MNANGNGNNGDLRTKVALLQERLRSYEAHIGEKVEEMEKRIDERVPLPRYVILEKIVLWALSGAIGVIISALAFFLTMGK